MQTIITQQCRKIAGRSYLISACFILAWSMYMSGYVIYIEKILAGSPWMNLIITTSLIFSFLFEVVCELLTGQYADQQGRRAAIRNSAWCCALGAVLLAIAWPLRHHPAPALLAAFSGIMCFDAGATFISGALEAWVVDSVQHVGGPSDCTGIFASLFWIKNAMWLLGGFVALTLQSWHPMAAWILCGGIMLGVMWPTTWTLREDYRASTPDLVVQQSTWKFLRHAGTYAWHTPAIRWLIVGNAGAYTASIAVAYYWVAALHDLLGHTITAQPIALTMPLAWTGFGIVRLLAATAAKWRTRQSTTVRDVAQAGLLALFPLVLLAPLCLVPLTSSLPANIFLCGILFAKFGDELFKPLFAGLMNRAISQSNIRATILSLTSAVGAFCASITLALLLLIPPMAMRYQYYFILLCTMASLGLLAGIVSYRKLRTITVSQ